MTNFLSIEKLKAFLSTKEQLIQKQNQIYATLKIPIKGIQGNTDLLPSGQRVKIIGRVTDNRFAITSNLNGNVTEAIVTEESLKDVYLES